MNRLALPFTLLRYSLPKSRSQAIYISNIVSIDRPGFCFFRRIRRFTIDRYAYTLSVGEKFFFVIGVFAILRLILWHHET